MPSLMGSNYEVTEPEEDTKSNIHTESHSLAL
jgi:hypothetical protein